MNSEQKAKWVKALRSGRYAQTRGQLKRGNAYCCLGVANVVCQLGVKDKYELSVESDFLSEEIESGLMAFNDDERMPFELIAGFIDCYIEPTE